MNNQTVVKIIGISTMVILFLVTCIFTMPAFAAPSTVRSDAMLMCSPPESLYASSIRPLNLGLSCNESKHLIMSVGNRLYVGNGVSVKLSAVEERAGEQRAILHLLNRNCSVFHRSSIASGDTIALFGVYSAPSYLSITVNQVAPGYTFGALWADVTFSRVC